MEEKARLWQTRFLSKWNKVFPYIPIEEQIWNFQREYYDAIASHNSKGDFSLFIEFMLPRIEEALDKTKKEIRTNLDIGKEGILLSNRKEGRTYKAQERMEKLELKSRISFREHHLKKALEEGLIEMTIPDKTNSRNQCYRLKKK